ncbi:MAG TPA: PGPGW domain-containing protein [Candidatus Binatia bacterium]|nr:PGPGW domain-containing protein [Candidatus Binatia bacterium]
MLVRRTIRAGRIVVGAALLLLGAVLSLPGIPGPGVLVAFGGLTLLAAEFTWAERLRGRMRDTFLRLTRRSPS